jgi:tripartite-type tricarboxylate transporter receptor subunit TctC
MTIKPDSDPRPAVHLLPPLEKGRVGEGIAGRRRGARGALANPLPNPPPEEGGGSARTKRRYNGSINRRGVLAGGIAALAAGRAAAADKYPSRTVTIVVPFPAGAVTDATARLMVDHLATAFGQSFVVENRGGGGGIPGAVTVARAQPDGATLVLATNTTHSAVQALYKSVPYDPIRDFTPVARLGGYVTLVVVHPDLPVRTIGELVAYAKANPGKLEYGHGNSGAQITGEQLKSANGLDIVRIAYRGNPQAMTDLIAGHIRMAATDLNTAMPHIRSGRIRPLAVATPRRAAAIPEVPTLSETVVPGFDALSWFGISGPAGMPREIVDALAAELQKFIARPDIQEKLAVMGAQIIWTGPNEMPQFMAAELVRWTRMVRDAGIEPE